MLRTMAALAALAASAAALSQTPQSTQQVQGLGPQLVVFAGSSGNFDSLVTGLTTGAPVTLATVLPDGSVQIVTFVPGTKVSATEAARILETARTNLIVRGIATPTSEQIAASLVGGTIVTPSGSATLTGVLTGSTTPPSTVRVRTESPLQAPAGAGLTAIELQAIRNALAAGTGVTLATSTAQPVTFGATGTRMSEFEVNQTLQLAATLLAQQGILNPTPDQLRVALFGGTLVTANGNVPVQGVLQGRVRNTSDSAAFGTSASPVVNTSASPAASTTVSPAANVSGQASGGTGGIGAGAARGTGQAIRAR